MLEYHNFTSIHEPVLDVETETHHFTNAFLLHLNASISITHIG